MTDPLRQALQAIWSTAAPAWGRHAEYIDARGAAVAQAMLDAADLRTGDQVLELGCGPGGVGLAAAEIVGAEGHVVLSDVAPEMTAIAAERASARGLANVATVELDLERIDMPDASFDTVLCREALMLVAEPPVAARETHRVMVPSGRAVFAVWGPPEDNPWLSTLINAVSAQLGSPVPPPGMPGPFALSGDGALAEVLTAGGFTDVAVRGVQSPMQMGTFDEWWNVVPSLAGPIAPILASLPTELTAAIRADAEAALAEFRTDNGYELPGLSLVGVGRNAVAQRRKE